jgi:hypothetical protein
MIRMLSFHMFFANTKASSQTVQSGSCCEVLFLAEAGDLVVQQVSTRQPESYVPGSFQTRLCLTVDLAGC